MKADYLEIKKIEGPGKTDIRVLKPTLTSIKKFISERLEEISNGDNDPSHIHDKNENQITFNYYVLGGNKMIQTYKYKFKKFQY